MASLPEAADAAICLMRPASMLEVSGSRGIARAAMQLEAHEDMAVSVRFEPAN
jgi:hypothetical protein